MNKYLATLFFILIPHVYAITPTSTPNTQEVLAMATTTAPITDIWDGYTLLEHICSCESWGDPNKIPREFDSNGKLITGYPNPNDKGACQINLPTWGKIATKIGLNVSSSLGDNIMMAKWIYDKYGTQPWNASKGCWGKYDNE